MLHLLGGSSAKAALRKFLQKVCTDELLMKHTWKSASGEKQPFMLYKELNATMYAAARKMYEEITEHTYEKFMQEHIKHAKFRDARR